MFVSLFIVVQFRLLIAIMLVVVVHTRNQNGKKNQFFNFEDRHKAENLIPWSHWKWFIFMKIKSCLASVIGTKSGNHLKERQSHRINWFWKKILFEEKKKYGEGWRWKQTILWRHSLDIQRLFCRLLSMGRVFCTIKTFLCFQFPTAFERDKKTKLWAETFNRNWLVFVEVFRFSLNFIESFSYEQVLLS